MPKQHYHFRFPPPLIQWHKQQAASKGLNLTQQLEKLMQDEKVKVERRNSKKKKPI